MKMFFVNILFALLFVRCSKVDSTLKKEREKNPSITEKEVIDRMMSEEVEKIEKDNNDIVPEYIKRHYTAELNIDNIVNEQNIKKYKKPNSSKKNKFKKTEKINKKDKQKR